MSKPIPYERLQEIRDRAHVATHCAVTPDHKHIWQGSFTHLDCTACRHTRTRGDRAEEAVELLAEVDRCYGLFERLACAVGALDFDSTESAPPQTDEQWHEFIRGIDERASAIYSEFVDGTDAAIAP